MSLLIIFAGGLIAYRIGKMLSGEEGPYSVFARIRGKMDPQQKTWVGRGMNCPFCISFWAALPAVCLLLWPFTLADALQVVACWVAAAGLASLLFSWELKS